MQNRIQLQPKNIEKEDADASNKTIVRAMTLDDIPAILAIEEVSFPVPWTEQSFISELKDNYLARYYCLEIEKDVIGYMGLWIVMGEAHITNIAIWPGCRGKGWGEYLLKSVMNEMFAAGVLRITLEVRVSNTTAQNLYTKLGFKPAGLRKKYYSDNQEDAVIMWASL